MHRKTIAPVIQNWIKHGWQVLAAAAGMITIPSNEPIKPNWPTIKNKGLYMKTISNPLIQVPVMTVGEAARFIGVGKKVVYQLIEFDEIRAIRERGKIMIDRSSLEAFHSSGKRP